MSLLSHSFQKFLEMAFLIVEFKVDEFTGNTEPEVAIIPRNWLDGTSCSVWPPFRSGLRIIRAIKKGEAPTSAWKSYPMRILDKEGKYNFTVLFHFGF